MKNLSKINLKKTKQHKTQKECGFIDRTPLRFIGGLFILIVGFFTQSTSLISLGVLDLAISFAFFFNPSIEDKKIIKLIVGLLYGFVLIWCVFWIMSKVS